MSPQRAFKEFTLILSILAGFVLVIVMQPITNWEFLSAFLFGFVATWLLYLLIRYIIVQVIRFVVKKFKRGIEDDLSTYVVSQLMDAEPDDVKIPDDAPERQSINLSLDEKIPFWVWFIIWWLITILLLSIVALTIGIPDDEDGIYLSSFYSGVVSLLITSLLYNKANTGKFQFLSVLKFIRFSAIVIVVVNAFWPPIVLIMVINGVPLLKSLFYFFLMVLVSGSVFGITHIILRLAGDKSGFFDD